MLPFLSLTLRVYDYLSQYVSDLTTRQMLL